MRDEDEEEHLNEDARQLEPRAEAEQLVAQAHQAQEAWDAHDGDQVALEVWIEDERHDDKRGGRKQVVPKPA